jgi:hypothetical protein
VSGGWRPQPGEPLEETIRRAVGWTAGRATLRASDAEREAVVDTLRRAHSEGRLDTAELEERISRCYSAKTLGELDRLVYDLPAPRTAAAQVRGRGWPLPFFATLAAVLFLAAIAFRPHVLFIWPLVIFLVLRFGRRWRMRQYL